MLENKKESWWAGFERMTLIRLLANLTHYTTITYSSECMNYLYIYHKTLKFSGQKKNRKTRDLKKKFSIRNMAK